MVRGLETGVPLVLYESGPRIVKLAGLLAERAPTREVVVFRELTKIHEEAIRAIAVELPSRLTLITLKGEFAIVLGPGAVGEDLDLDAEIVVRLRQGDRPASIARELAKMSQVPRSALYEQVMRIQRGQELP